MFRSFLRNDSGTTTIEYGFVAAVVSTLLLSTASAMSLSVQDLYGSIENEVRAVDQKLAGGGAGAIPGDKPRREVSVRPQYRVDNRNVLAGLQ